MITYDKLWKLLESKNIAPTRLKVCGVVNGHSFDSLVSNSSVTIKTIERICEYLDCQPGDIMEYRKEGR